MWAFPGQPVGGKFLGSVEKVGGSLDMSKVSIQGQIFTEQLKRYEKWGS